MKAALSLLVLVATITLARAGEFAGPPPFTNDSPLLSGTDGTYQAIASGTNLTGVFSFVISGGLQTSDQSVTINSWVFFIDGNLFNGSVTAAISRGKVAGILNGGGASVSIPTGTNGVVSLPTAFIVPGDTASGEFTGSIGLNSPLGVFEGKGTLQGFPGRTDQLVFISEPTQTVTDANGVTIPGNTNTVIVTNITIPSSLTFGGNEAKFRFNGTRVSTTPATPPAPAAAPSPAAAAATTTNSSG